MKVPGPMEIEQASLSIIADELGDRVREWNQFQLPLVLRVIHASADFDYADHLFFSPSAVEHALQALQSKTTIVTDTNMAKSGISKSSTAALGCDVQCLMADQEVAQLARQRGETRASVSMELAAQRYPHGIYVVGNAPTALLKIIELVEAGQLDPALVIGVPVGFVNVVESKEALYRRLSCPRIISFGRKGGSSVAAALVNALLYQLAR